LRRRWPEKPPAEAGGVVTGFAFKDILQNWLAGLPILLGRPFSIGDQIVVDGFEGTVERIDTRSTDIRTYDGRWVLIPNSEVYTGAVVVNTAFDKRRSENDVGVGYGDRIAEARRILLDAVRGSRASRPTPRRRCCRGSLRRPPCR
jgi:small conductance mechanosensitive channel